MSTGSTVKQYPAALDTFATWEDDIDNILAVIVNDVQEQVIVIETELGTDPAGSVADVKTRLAVEINNDGTLKKLQRKTITVIASAGTYAFDFTDESLNDYAGTDYHISLTTVGTNAGNAWATVSGARASTGFTIALRQAGVNGSAPYNADVGAGGNVEVDVICHGV